MKILLANKFFFRNGGSEVVMFQERDFLLEAGHEVVDFSMQDDRNLPSESSDYFVGSRNYRHGGLLSKASAMLSFIHSQEAVRKVAALIDVTKPDVMHCHNIYHQLTPSIIGAATVRGVPVVLTLHDYKVVCPAYTRSRNARPCSECLDGDYRNVLRHRCADGSLGKSALLYAEAVVQRRFGSYEHVDSFIAPSRFMKDAVAHRIPEERIRLLYNGMDVDAVAASTTDAGYVLYLGRLSIEKGVSTLLAAHATVRQAWPLHIAGTGPLEDELRRRYPAARFLGHLTKQALRDAIASAAIVVVPSEWFENCPMSILEAMTYGKPVVASRMGGIPELVRDGETGLLFDAADVAQLTAAIGRLMSSHDLRREMGAKARARVESDFSLAVHNRGLLQIYESVLKH